jgi:hypothetical protein
MDIFFDLNDDGHDGHEFNVNEMMNSTQLKENEWVEINITKAGESFYYWVGVEPGATYYFWLDEVWDGSGKYHGEGMFFIADLERNILNDQFSDIYTNPFEFTSDFAGTLYVKVRIWEPWNIGSFAIAYNKTGVRP